MPRAYNDHSNHDRRDERKLADFDAISKRVVSLATQGSASLAGLVERQAEQNAAALVDEFEHAAAVCAFRRIPAKGAAAAVLGTTTISAGLREQIECDPDAFGQRVSDYAYGQAMEKVHGI
jgi:hypothetical protein